MIADEVLIINIRRINGSNGLTRCRLHKFIIDEQTGGLFILATIRRCDIKEKIELWHGGVQCTTVVTLKEMEVQK